MIQITPQMRVLVAIEPTDFRRGIDGLKPGDPCPECPINKRGYALSPRTLVRVVGQAPLQATVYELEALRCNLCVIDLSVADILDPVDRAPTHIPTQTAARTGVPSSTTCLVSTAHAARRRSERPRHVAS